MYKVLKGFNGLSKGEVVDTVERKPRAFGERYNKSHEISYQGNYHTLFLLPESYGELAGWCIALKDWEFK